MRKRTLTKAHINVPVSKGNPINEITKNPKRRMVSLLFEVAQAAIED